MRMTPALRTLFESYRRRAGKLASKDVLKLIKDAADKQTRWTAVAGSQDLADFIEMLRCFVGGEYQDLSKKTIGIVAGTLLYFVAPLDLLPDLLPAVGFIDDFAVIAFAVNAVLEEIERFRLWRGTKTRASADAKSHAATTSPQKTVEAPVTHVLERGMLVAQARPIQDSPSLPAETVDPSSPPRGEFP